MGARGEGWDLDGRPQSQGRVQALRQLRGPPHSLLQGTDVGAHGEQHRLRLRQPCDGLALTPNKCHLACKDDQRGQSSVPTSRRKHEHAFDKLMYDNVLGA